MSQPSYPMDYAQWREFAAQDPTYMPYADYPPYAGEAIRATNHVVSEQTAAFAAYLHARGTTTIKHMRLAEDGSTVYFFKSAQVDKLSTFVRFTAGGMVDFVFTTGDPFFNDNFDFDVSQGVLPTENCAFGVAKSMTELAEIDLFLNDPVAFVASVDYPGFIRGRAMPPPPPEGADVYSHYDAWLARLLAANYDAMMRDVDGRVKKQTKWANPAVDPVVRHLLAEYQRTGGGQALKEQVELALTGPPSTLQCHFAHRMPVAHAVFAIYKLDRQRLYGHQAAPAEPALLLEANPRIAKLSVGRVTLPSFQAPWTNDSQAISEWAVFFARRFFLAHSPMLGFAFCLVHRHATTACEISNDDEIWAYKLPTDDTDAKGPIDKLFFFDAFQPARFETLHKIGATAHKRKLGTVNARVARSLMGLALDADVEAHRQVGEAYLRSIGWTQWFDEMVADRLYPGQGFSVLDHHTLPPELCHALYISTVHDLSAFISALTAHLPHTARPTVNAVAQRPPA